MSERATFKVCAKRCERCLFSANPIVSAERRREVLDNCMTEGAETYFVCHETENTCCGGFYDSVHSDRVAIIQIARRLKLVEFV